MSDIEGKVAREAMSECGQRASFNLGERSLEVFYDFGRDDVRICLDRFSKMSKVQV